VFAAAGQGAGTILSTYFGGLAGLGAGAAGLPGTHLGLDLVAAPESLELLPALPAGRGVCLGLFDARSARVEDALDVAAALAPWREALCVRDVLVGPNAGLELLPRDAAFDKLLQARYLVEHLAREWTWAC
jgi:methionine synthase II (cobalamin-independent)